MKDFAPDILIVTQHDDPTATFLVPYLEKAGLTWVQWDSGELLTKNRAGFHLQGDHVPRVAFVDADNRRINIQEVGVVWYRRPTINYAPAGIPTKDVGTFIDEECAHLVANLWRCLEVPMVNDPILGHLASQKSLQLRVAARLGFRTPITYMGNDPEAIRSLWLDTGGSMIVKGFRSASVDTGKKGEKALYTSLVDEADLADDAPLAACPSIWQEKIEKKVEIRATVMGDRVLAAEIHSQDADVTSHDWRNLGMGNAPHYPHGMPDHIAERCIRLVNESKLHFGAMDLILTPSDEYVFLENNPFGQWAWMQDMCGLPLAESHCDLFRQLIRQGGAKYTAN